MSIAPPMATTIMTVAATLLAGSAAFADSDGPAADHGPVTIVSDSQFYSLLKSGQLHPTGRDEALDELRQFKLQERRDRKIVEEFIDQHPDLSGLAQLVAVIPTDPECFPHSTATTNGHSPISKVRLRSSRPWDMGAKLAALADSIQAAADPIKKLALYTALFTKYTAQYDRICTSDPLLPPPAGCANLTPPSALTDPGALLNASIDVIDSAL